MNAAASGKKRRARPAPGGKLQSGKAPGGKASGGKAPGGKVTSHAGGKAPGGGKVSGGKTPGGDKSFGGKAPGGKSFGGKAPGAGKTFAGKAPGAGKAPDGKSFGGKPSSAGGAEPRAGGRPGGAAAVGRATERRAGPGRPAPRPAPPRAPRARVDEPENTSRWREIAVDGADELDAWSTRPVPDKPRRGDRRAPRRDFDPDEVTDEPGPVGPRRPLSHVGGKVERLEGPSALTTAIRTALEIDPERGVRDHVHGFHSYPARLHPVTAANLITSLAPEQGSVADPFCGCGTVLVEARRLGRKAIGVDLNPLAVRLTRFKTQPLDAAEREELLAAAARVAEHADERRRAAAGPTHRYAPAQREAFDVHVLLELDGLNNGIKQEEPGFRRQALSLALSSIFSKVGRENSAEGPSKRLASGFTIRFFVSRVGELVRQLAEYEALLPEKAPGPHVREADARELGRLDLRNIDLFVSSPPYPGVLDYAEYHRTRLSWLNLDATRFEQLEMGARRHLQRLDHEQAAAAWEADFVKVLTAMRSALAPEGRIALVLADSLLAGKPYPADVVVERTAKRAGLSVVARGSQKRPHFHRQSAQVFGSRQRYEHLLLLAPAAR